MNWLVTNRGVTGRTLVDEDGICLIKRDREVYSSLFYYDNQMAKYLEKNGGSPAGYNGPVYGHHFVIDFDCADDPRRVAKALLPLLKNMYDLEIVHWLFSSGSKGFHLYVQKAYVDYPIELENKWNLACRAFAVKLKDEYPELTEFIDETIYDKQRIFRYPYSIHPKSKKRKRELVIHEFPSDMYGIPLDGTKAVYRVSQASEMSIIEQIFKGFYPKETPAEVLFDIADSVTDDAEPVSPYREDTSQIGEGLIAASRYAGKECITAMMNDSNLTGRRHNVALRIASHLCDDLGFSKDLARPVMRAWNDHLSDPMDDESIERTLSYYERYSYGCNDEIKKQYCDPKCMYYNFRNTQSDHLFHGGAYYKRLLEAAQAPTDHDIRYGRVYPDMGSVTPTKPDRGHVVVVAAGPSVGKTTFMLNLMAKYTDINWMFMSYEMTGEDIAEKLWVSRFGDPMITDQRRDEFERGVQHIVTVDDPTIRLNDIPKVWRMIKAETGKTCKAIVIDYLQLAPVGGAVATERAIAIAKSAKELAKELKVAVFLLSQVPKELAGDGNLPLPMQAPKDSGEIVNLADLQLNLWRPYRNKSRDGEDDNILTVFVAKNRHGQACQEINLHFTGSAYRIDSYYPDLEERNAA